MGATWEGEDVAFFWYVSFRRANMGYDHYNGANAIATITMMELTWAGPMLSMLLRLPRKKTNDPLNPLL